MKEGIRFFFFLIKECSKQENWSFVTFCIGWAREKSRILICRPALGQGSWQVSTCHPWERGRTGAWVPWLVSHLLNCWALCGLFCGCQISVVGDPLLNFSEILIFIRVGIISATEEPFNVTETEQEAVLWSCRPGWDLLGASVPIPETQFWMKDSFNNFLSDPFLPMKLLFWE